MAIDPVCGMEVITDATPATYQSKHKNKAGTENTYYFCSKDCKDEFDEAPNVYLDADDEGPEPEIDYQSIDAADDAGDPNDPRDE